MGGKWCYLCDLRPDDWSQLEHGAGNPWTLSRMKRRIEQIESLVLKDKPVNRRGCVEEPLFSVFEPSDYIPPCLHIMMGAYNDALKSLLLYIDIRHEKVPIVEIAARQESWKARVKLEAAQKELDDFLAGLSNQIEERRDEIRLLEDQKQLENPPGQGMRKYVYNQEQKRVISVQIGFLKEEIKQLESGEKERKALIESLGREAEAALKVYEQHRKQRNAVDSEVRQKIERLLADNGVDRGAHHGGDLTGVSCLKLEQNILEIMDGMKEILKSAPGVTTELKEEIDEQLESYELHFLLLSQLFSLARTEKRVFKGDLARKQELLQSLRTTISLVNSSTHRLGLSMKTVKRHVSDDHLVSFISHLDGIAEYQEDWLEQIHQSYKKFNARAKIRNKETSSRFEIKLEAIRNNVAVAEAGQRMWTATKRNFNAGRERLPASFALQRARRKRREEAIERATSLFAEKPHLLNAHAFGIEEYNRSLEENATP
jgi:hypothetical protein